LPETNDNNLQIGFKKKYKKGLITNQLEPDDL